MFKTALFVLTVMATVGVCVALSILAPKGNLVAVVLLAWGSGSLGAVAMELCQRK